MGTVDRSVTPERDELWDAQAVADAAGLALTTVLTTEWRRKRHMPAPALGGGVRGGGASKLWWWRGDVERWIAERGNAPADTDVS